MKCNKHTEESISEVYGLMNILAPGAPFKFLVPSPPTSATILIKEVIFPKQDFVTHVWDAAFKFLLFSQHIFS